MIHGDDFGDDGDVLPGIEINRNLRQLDIQNAGSLHVESSPFDDGILIPLLELHHNLDALLLADRPDTEDRLDVDQPHAADLHVMPLHLVSASDENIVAALA